MNPADVPSQSSPPARSAGDPTLVWWSAAALLLLIDALFDVVLTNARDKGAAYVIGAFLGGATIQVLLCLAVYGVARMMGKARTGVGRARLAFFTVAVLFLLTTATLVGRFGGTRMTDDERQGLQVTKDSIRHAAFGFVLPLPSPDYTVSSEQQQMMDSAFAKTPSMVGWAYLDTITGESIAIMVARLARVNEKAFRGFVTGVRRGYTQSKVLGDSVIWHDKEGEYRLDLLHPSGVYISMRCLPNRRPLGGVIVCVQTTTAQLHELESVTTGLKLAPE